MSALRSLLQLGQEGGAMSLRSIYVITLVLIVQEITMADVVAYGNHRMM